MDSFTNMQNDNTLPWYDDRVKEVICGTRNTSHNTDSDSYNTPKKIYRYLDGKVWKQDEAKKAAAILTYNSFFRGVKENAMFIGPTGCGKTHIWRCLQKLFPERIEITDGSTVTAEGFKGDRKWSTLLQSPVFESGKAAILVIDEADKMLAPKITSAGESAGQNISAEGLKLMEGTFIDIKSGSVTYQVDTSRISFVLCGAFSNKANEIAKDSNIGHSIGFGATSNAAKAYDRPMTTQDLIEYGVMPEFMGRIQRIVNLQPMLLDDYYKIMSSGCSPVHCIQEQYGVKIHMTTRRRRELAEDAFKKGFGIRGIESSLRELVDNSLFEDCNRQCLEI